MPPPLRRVDWSGGARRRAGRSDMIWIAHGPRTADTPLTNSPHSRTEAIELIEAILERAIKSKQRVLLCFDFAYGYPVDFAAALQAATGKSDRDLPRITVWQYLSEHLKDDGGTTPGAKPTTPAMRNALSNGASRGLSAFEPSFAPSRHQSTKDRLRVVPPAQSRRRLISNRM
jgi:hypothetical protein